MKWRENPVPLKLTLLVIIGIIGVLAICFFTNAAFKSLRLTVKEFQYPDQKIKHLNNLMEQTNNSDTYLRLYIITKKDEYLKKYNTNIDSVARLFKAYHTYTENDPIKSGQIDSIQFWWNSKMLENRELIQLNKERPNIRVISNMMDETTDTTLFSTQISKEKVIRDSLVVIKRIPVSNEQRTGLLHKVKRVFSRKGISDDDSLLIRDNLNIEMFSYTHKKQDTTITDTLVKLQSFNDDKRAKVKNVILEKLEFDTIINLKRLAIIEKDLFIRNKISRQIKNIQAQEQANAQQNISTIQDISTKTINQIFWIFLIVLLICLCLYILLILDAYRIKRYEERLIYEKKNYQELASNRAQFLSMMAHELRTPLQSIIGFSQLMEEKQKHSSSKSNQYTEIIQKSSAHLLQTINLLLDRSKIDAGKLELEHIAFHLNDTIEDVFESLSIQAEEKNILYTLFSDIPKDLLAYSDSFRLKQVLYNLLNNAIKFTDAGTVTLICSAGKIKGDIIDVHFKISDTGKGIPEEKIKFLFEEYHQLDKSTGRLFGGTGLGLVITKKILRLFSSDLRVENKQTGTSFLFDIDFKIADSLPEQSSESLNMKGATILVVDDDSYNLLYTHQLLNACSLSVSISSTIHEARQHLAEQVPDIILCDLYINESMGTDLLPFIQPNTKIIFMSADHDHLQELRNNHFVLPKPFTIDDLIAVLNSLGIAHTETVADTKALSEGFDRIHEESFAQKIDAIEASIKENDASVTMYYLHQIKTTLGYLNRWEEIKHIQKTESSYLLHKNDLDLFYSVSEMLVGWKDIIPADKS